MDYFLTDEQKEIRNLARQIADEKIAPVAIEYDEKGEFAWEIVEILAKSDLCGLYIDEKYGGLGGGVFELCLVTEELSRACGGIALSIAATALGAFPIILSGSEDQKERYLPDIAKGKKLAAFAITEADAGSDVGAMQTTARREENFYILNGTKQWITNAGEAEIYVVIAMTNKSKGPRGASAFIVEKGFPGISFGKKENKMGIRSSATREVIFDDCKVPKENLLGGEGKGFIIALKNFDHSRPGVGAQAIGIAQGALEKAVQYAKEREQFGSPISSFQGIQFMLADMATQIEAARALVYSVAKAIDSGQKGFAKESAMAKLFASDVAMKVTTDAVQIFGGYGYMKEYPIEKMMRDAKITQIYEGTNQIQRSIIAHALIKEAASKKKK
ncbi:MAG TPA: acyl-CoA dehydrogenase family protein [Nitrospinota bacterium]|nr:acyl-CoA dehydrogenase family protein [Nitrospinota bacterium]